MLHLIGKLYIFGWVVSIILVVIVLLKYFSKMKRIKEFYNYGRNSDIVEAKITVRAYSRDNQKLVNNKEEQRIEVWQTSKLSNDIHIRSIYYIGEAQEFAEEVSGYEGGTGGSGCYNPLSNTSLNIYDLYGINEYYNSHFAKTTNPGDEKYIRYIDNITVRVIFVNKEELGRADSRLWRSLYNSYVYVVDPYNESFDAGYFINKDGYFEKGWLSTQRIKDILLEEISSNQFYCLVESKRKRNYRLFKGLNFYLRNEE